MRKQASLLGSSTAAQTQRANTFYTYCKSTWYVQLSPLLKLSNLQQSKYFMLLVGTCLLTLLLDRFQPCTPFPLLHMAHMLLAQAANKKALQDYRSQ